MHTAKRLLLLLLALILGALILPVAAPADDAMAFRNGDFMALNTHGTATNTSKDPNRTVFSFDLYSLGTGQKVGTGVDDVFCSTEKPPPCAVFDAITMFHLPDGDLVNHAQVSVAFDPQKPGWVIVAAGGDGTKSIVTDKGTGAYAGRTGSVRLRGVDDTSHYPNRLTQDDFWAVELDPR